MKMRQHLDFRNAVAILGICGACTSLACQKAETDQNSGMKRYDLYATVSLDGFNEVLTSKQPLTANLSPPENKGAPTGKAELGTRAGDTVVAFAFLVDPLAENLTGSYDLSGNRENGYGIGVHLRKDKTFNYKSVEGTITLVQKGNDVSGSFKARMVRIHVPDREIVPTDAAEEISLSGSVQATAIIRCLIPDPDPNHRGAKMSDDEWASPFCQSMIRWRFKKVE